MDKTSLAAGGISVAGRTRMAWNPVRGALALCDPRQLDDTAPFAELLESARWQVVAVMAYLPRALLALPESGPAALVFDVSDHAGSHEVGRVAQQARARNPAMLLVLLTAHVDPWFLRRALNCGLDACMHKHEPPELLRHALGHHGVQYRSPLVNCLIAQPARYGAPEELIAAVAH
jgi:CheY-like chemotaxis protein